MRIVLDTNVLVAAFVAHGSCNDLLEHCLVHHDVVVSRQILDELRDVLVRKLHFTRAETQAVIKLVLTRMHLVTPDPLEIPVCRDPDDDVILATARAGQCRVLVTGDKDLTDLDRYGHVKILTPAQFWEYEDRDATAEER